MEFVLPLVSLAAIQLLAVISPGQSFLVVSKLSLSSGRYAGISASMGMGFGSVIWASAAIAGLALVLEQAIWLYSILKLAGGAYLIYLAYLLWNQAREKISIDAAPAHHISTFRAFGLGLLTQLANPKVIVFFGSIFFALLPADAPGWVYFASVLIVFTNETVWYSIVSLVFSIQQSRNAYMRARCLIDRGMAVALGGIGGKLVVDAIQTPSNN